jgi:hypothetical protein
MAHPSQIGSKMAKYRYAEVGQKWCAPSPASLSDVAQMISHSFDLVCIGRLVTIGNSDLIFVVLNLIDALVQGLQRFGAYRMLRRLI